MGGFFGFIGGIIGFMAGAIAAIPLLPAIVGGAVIGVVLCVTGTICPNSGSNNTNNGTTVVTPVQTPKNNNHNNNPGNSNSGSEAGATACSTSGVNGCNMHGTGFLSKSGICSATVPPDSSCPAPLISTQGFYASPTLVRSGQQTTLYWSVSNATTCTLSGGSVGGILSSLTGNKLTGSITQKTVYTLACQDGAGGGPKTSANVTVNLIPSEQEI